MQFDAIYKQLLEAHDPHMGRLYKVGDVVQLKYAQLSKPTTIYRYHKPGDRFEVVGRVAGIGSSRSFYVRSIDTDKQYSVPGYHIQSIDKPLKKVCRVPKRLRGNMDCANCGNVFDLSLPGSKHRDHCPHCLCSVHIDTRPGDREVWCGEGEPCTKEFKHAVLRPIAKNSQYDIVYIQYKCDKCGKLKVNVQAFDDNQNLIDQLLEKHFKIEPYNIQ